MRFGDRRNPRPRPGFWFEMPGRSPKTLLPALLIAAAAALLAAPAAPATFAGRPGSILFAEDGLEVYNTARGTHRLVTSAYPYTPTFLPDGRHFVYVNSDRNAIYARALHAPNPAYAGREILRHDEDLGIRALSVSRSGLIVFSAVAGGFGGQNVGNRIEIYSVRLDGSDLTRLTDNRVFDNDPDISPDGSRIAFVRRVSGRAQIFTMNADGSRQRRITRDSGRDRAPSFSPSGRRIAFFGSLPGHTAQPWNYLEIFTITPAGRHLRRLTDNEVQDAYPSYSPNGNRVVFTRGNSDLVTARVNGADERIIYSSSYLGGINSPDWGRRPGT